MQTKQAKTKKKDHLIEYIQSSAVQYRYVYVHALSSPCELNITSDCLDAVDEVGGKPCSWSAAG